MKKRQRTTKAKGSRVDSAKGKTPQTTNGVMRPDTGALGVPSDLNEEDSSRSVLPNKVVLVITLLALLFIAIIAWFVSRMPAKAG